MKLLAAYVLFVVLLLPAGAAAVISGSAEWNWAKYRRSVDGGEDQDASHFYQDYSLLYQDRQLIQGGRAGAWTIGLGYEWSALAGEIGAVDTDVTADKILFEGELTFTPAGLPFRLHAYSRDLAKQSPTLLSDSSTIISPDIYDGLNGSQHVTSGVTLVAGGHEANFLGDYREALQALPRLLVDYREEYVRDVDSFTPQHYSVRDLAFISLNRKHNWFHYKIFDYNDFNDSTNDYRETTWLLGTIDHLNRRQWVHLTNWLTISVDGSLTKTEGSRYVYNGDNEDIYRLNLFSSGKRRDWEFANYASLSRSTSDYGIERTLDFPLFASGQADPLHKWRLTFLGSRWDESYSAVNAFPSYKNSSDSLYANAELESRKYQGKILIPEIEIDWIRNTNGDDGQAARAGVELRSDNSLDRARNWLAACSVAAFENTTRQLTYYEQALRLAVDYNLSPRLSAGGSVDAAVGSGDYSNTATTHLAPTISQGFANGDVEERSLSGTSYRSTVNAYVELTSSSQLRNRFALYHDFVHTDEDLYQVQLSHYLSWSQREWSLRATTLFVEGDELDYRWNADDVPALDLVTGRPDFYLSHETLVDYAPNRYWDLHGRGRALWGSGEKDDGWQVEVEQYATYHLYEASGIPREWLSLEQRFEYQGLWGNDYLWYAQAELYATYYVTRFLTFQANAGVTHYALTDQNEYAFGLSATATFRKLEARIAYAYGQADDGDFAPGVTEQRWEIGLKKYF